MVKKGDILIQGGTIVDPVQNVCREGNVLIRGKTIAEIAPGETVEAKEVVKATGFLVTPGLIDSHTHVFFGGTEIGIVPDLSLLPMGVTSVVDAGSAGTDNCEGFMNSVLNSHIRVFYYINVSPTGVVTERYPECLEPKYYDLHKMEELFSNYAGKIVGLKVRQGQEIVGNLGLEPLKGAIRIAEHLRCRVNVHTTNPPGDIVELASILRPGDIFGHCFHGIGSSIIGQNSKVKQGIWQARDNGVIFDSADGRTNHSYPVIKAALADGFAPDVISTDVIRASLFGNTLFGLPVVMSKYLSLGIPLIDVVKACTATPAKIIGMGDRLGTLAPGSLADIAVFRLEKKSFTFQNRLGETFCGDQLLIPQMTIMNGKVVYRQVDF